MTHWRQKDIDRDPWAEQIAAHQRRDRIEVMVIILGAFIASLVLAYGIALLNGMG